MTKKTENRGGHREGSGRPKSNAVKKTATFSLSKDVIEILNKYPGRKSQIVEEAVLNYISGGFDGVGASQLK